MTMVACPNCAHELATDAAFCPSCGAPVPAGSATPRRPRGRWLAVGLGIVGIAALGVIGFRLVSTTGAEFVGGAGSPEAAVEELASALASEDVFAATSFIAPDEIDGLSDVLDSLLSTIDAGSGGLVDGTDLAVEVALTDVEASMQGDDAAIVSFEVSGSAASGATDGPIGVALPSSSVSFRADDLEDLYPGRGNEVELVTVKLGGKWFVSPMLSFGHLIVENNDLPGGDFDRVGAERRGGGSDPEGAVDAMFAAIEDRDADDFAESLGGGEGRFATVFSDAIDELLGEIPSDVGYSVDARTSPGDGDGVILDDVEVAYFDAYGSGSTEVDGDCISVVNQYGERDRVCLLDELPLIADVENTIDVQTVEEDGGWRVRLVPTVTDVAARLVPAFERQTYLYAAGLEWADTATPVTVGSDTDIDLDGAWYAVHEFDAVANQRYRVTTERDESRLWYRDEDGQWTNTWRNSITPTADTKIRVVTYADVDYDRCDAFCFPDAGGSDTLRVRAVPVQTGQFPAILTGELGPGDEILFDLEVATAENVQIDFAAAESVSWDFDGGNYSWLSDGAYALEAGELRIAVSNNGSDSGAFELTPGPVTTGFDGARSVVVDIGSGPASTEVLLPGGFSTITAFPLDGQDIVLAIDDVGCFADVGFSGDSEECGASVDASSRVRVEVFGYGSSDEYGQVELVLS